MVVLGMNLSSPLQSDVHVPNCTTGSAPASSCASNTGQVHHFLDVCYHPVLNLFSQFIFLLLILLCSFHHVLF